MRPAGSLPGPVQARLTSNTQRPDSLACLVEGIHLRQQDLCPLPEFQTRWARSIVSVPHDPGELGENFRKVVHARVCAWCFKCRGVTGLTVTHARSCRPDVWGGSVERERQVSAPSPRCPHPTGGGLAAGSPHFARPGQVAPRRTSQCTASTAWTSSTCAPWSGSRPSACGG